MCIGMHVYVCVCVCVCVCVWWYAVFQFVSAVVTRDFREYRTQGCIICRPSVYIQSVYACI